MPKLTVVNGGGGSEPTPPEEKEFREHPLAGHLWKAIYPRYAGSTHQIAERMSESAGIEVAHHQAWAAITHVRSHPYEYGWDIPNVQKGAVGKHRKYFPVLVDAKDHKMRVSDYKDCVREGAYSAAMTVSTMGEHSSVAIEIIAENDPNLTMAEKRKLRAASGMFTAAAEMAQQVLGSLKVVA